jgi:hypothetical protein
MSRKSLSLFGLFLLLSVPFLATPAQAATTATAAATSLNLPPVQVSSGATSTATASFTVTGYAGSFTPTASAHYGKDFSLGAVNCTAAGASETCTVAVTFSPTLPGMRRDAIFLTDGVGGTRLATVQLGGTGEAPLALVQPGNVMTKLASTPAYYNYNSAVDENGTVYSLTSNTTTSIAQLDKTGTVGWLLIAGGHSLGGIAIDGAGMLYFGIYGYGDHLLTYDTVTGVQGTLSMVPPGYTPCSNAGSPGNYLWYFAGIATDQSGNVYANETLCEVVIEHKTDGSFAWFALNPKLTQLWNVAVDSSGDVFASGYAINKIVPGGAQTQVNATTAVEGLAVDAADSLYDGRYNYAIGHTGIAVLPASDYTAPIAGFDNNAVGAPLGESLASDGTVYLGDYTQVDKFDRSQGLLDFATQNVGTKSAVKTTGIYNGGNQPLVLSDIAVTGDGFAFVASASNGCTTATTLAPGAFCNIDVTVTPTHGGNNTGTIVFTTNSLNGVSATQTVALKAAVNGAYLTAAPPAIDFGNVPAGVTSAAQTVTITDIGVDYSFGGAPSLSAATVPTGFSVDTSKCTNLVANSSTSSCPVPVTFSPTATTAYSGTVTIPYTSSLLPSGSHSTVTFTVVGNGGTSGISISPLIITFGSLGTGLTSPTNLVTVTNTGTAPLHISAIALTGANPGQFKITAAGSCSTSTPLAVGGSCTIPVVFAPTVAASDTASLTLTDDAPSAIQSVALSGTGTFNDPISVTPNPLDWGDEPLSSTWARTITFTNNGSVPVSITGNPSTVTNTNFIVISTTCGPTVAAGASCTITVIFNAGATAGAYTDTLTIPDTSVTGPHTVALKANGVVPTFTLTAPNLVPASPMADFVLGSIGLGTTGTVQTLTLTNTSTVDGTISLSHVVDFGNSGTIAFIGTTCGLTLAGGTSCTFSFQFTASATIAGLKENDYKITTNGTPNPINFMVTATAVAATLTVTPASLNFSTVGINTTSTAQTVTITNTSSVTATFSSIAPTVSTGQGTFNLTNNCGVKLPAGTSCTISVSFTASSIPSPATETIRISSDASTSPQFVNLTATGTAATLTVTPPTLSFGSVVLNTTSTAQTVTITNTSSVTATFSSIAPTVSTGQGTFNLTNNCGATLAAGASCTLSISFTASSIPSPATETIRIGSDASTSPQFINLSATGGALLTPSANSHDFGNVTAGTSSTPTTVIVTNVSTIPAHILLDTITNSFNFKDTSDTCMGATVAPGASCTVTMIFTPIGSGAQTSQLALSSDAANSPLTVDLSGTGVLPANDFTVTATPPTQTIVGGGAATYTITVTPNIAGYPRDVAFTVTGLPAGATATFSPTPVVPNNAAVSATMTVQTTALVQNETSDNGMRLAGFGGGLLSLVCALLAALLGRARLRMRGYFIVALACFALAAATVLTGCIKSLPLPVTSTITITGTHSTTIHTTTVQLTVQ